MLGHALLLLGVSWPLSLALPAAPVGELRVQVSVRDAPASAVGVASSALAAPAERPSSPVSPKAPRPRLAGGGELPSSSPRKPSAPAVIAAPSAEVSTVVPQEGRGSVASATAAATIAAVAAEPARAASVGRGGAEFPGTPGTPSSVSLDDLRHYRVALASAARRFKRYPPLARERGWEGTAEVAVMLRAGGPRPEVMLLRSSGREMLDAQALEMVTQAVRLAALPSALRNRDLRIDLPVRFSLEEGL